MRCMGIAMSVISLPALLQAGLVQTVDFENGGISMGANTEVEYAPYAFLTNSTDYARRGTRSVRAEVLHGGKRAETVSNKRGAIGVSNWYGWSIYIPSGFTGDVSREIVSQFHDWHQNQPTWAKDGTAPTCFVLETNGKLIFSLKYDFPTGDNDPEHSTFDLGPYVKGAWTDIVMQVNWTHQTTGFVKIWVNGVQKLNYTGSTYMPYTYSNPGPFFKMGDYKGITTWGGQETRVFYFDEFRMGDANSSYEEVDPAPPLVDVEAEADAHVRPSSFGDVNYGSATTLIVKDDPNVKYDYRSYLRFDLTAFSGNINSAKLILTPAQLGANVALSNFDILLVADDNWQENVITWNNKPAASTYLADIPVTGLAVGQPVEIDLTAIAQAEKAVNGKLSIALIPMSLGSDRFATFHSFEASSGQPILRLE